MEFFTSGQSDKGEARSTNQDSLLVKQMQIKNEQVTVVAVSDGVGSLEDGEIAAILSSLSFKQWCEKNLHKLVRKKKKRYIISRAIEKQVRVMNKEVIKVSRKNNIKTATTFSVLVIVDNYYIIAHVGDSRVYKFNLQEGGYIKLTKDHCVVRNNKRLLAQYLGREKDMHVQMIEDDIKGDEAFLVCSDGYYNLADMHQLLQSLEQVGGCEELSEVIKNQILEVRRKKERDNVSLAIVIPTRRGREYGNQTSYS